MVIRLRLVGEKSCVGSAFPFPEYGMHSRNDMARTCCRLVFSQVAIRVLGHPMYGEAVEIELS